MSLVLPKCSISPASVSAVLRTHQLLLSEQNIQSAGTDPTGFSTDSRKAGPGCGFIAYAGVASDGHNYIAGANAAGAAFIVCERPVSEAAVKVPVFVVTSGRAAWSVLAAAACGSPQNSVTMLGVTGTNGKTSTAWMTRQLLQHAGIPCVMIGTLGAWIGDNFHETKHTTPDPDYFYPMLKHALDAGIRTCVMEVSSHAIAQEKLTPVTYDAAAFTSFSRDHLDFHKDEDDYFATKSRLFDRMTKPGGTKIFCSRLSRLPASAGGDDSIIYGLSSLNNPYKSCKNQLEISVDRETLSGSEITVRGKKGLLPYFGAHALENFAAALLLASRVTEKVWDEKHWSRLSQVPGRLERVTGTKDVDVFVDYAHTPDALEKTLTFLKKYRKRSLLVVFGCGGDRDPGKRPQMGAIACGLADCTFVTSDNPRTEDPAAIIRQILAGTTSGQPVTSIADRREAIAAAIQKASPGDIILIAGKGHETYQIIGDKVLPFDDREVARAFLNSSK
jgi:UDP-N-acetylmuramoyl-L-alanyl-D-glutamate--2,6-diaminopimelate ligase